MRGIGIEYTEDRNKASRTKTLTEKKPAKDRHRRHPRHPEEKDLQNEGFVGDGPGDVMTVGDDHQEKTVTKETPANTHIGGGDDANDDDLRPYSKTGCSYAINERGEMEF